MAYKEILGIEYEQFHKTYKMINKKEPSLSKLEKSKKALTLMIDARHKHLETYEGKVTEAEMLLKSAQYMAECHALTLDMAGKITRYYLKSEDLFEFFKNTELFSKTVDKILDELPTDRATAFGIMGKQKSYCMYIIRETKGDKVLHVVNILNDDMNSSFVPEYLSEKSRNESDMFKLTMNFLLYIKAYPEMVIDGVPNDVKKDKVGKSLDISPKVVSHTTNERGITRTHFRSGHFRHLDSDYYKNKKGQVIFIAGTVVNGAKAKTVLSRQGA